VTNTGELADNYILTVSNNILPSWNPTLHNAITHSPLTVDLLPIDDAYVGDLNSGTNYGTSGRLYVGTYYLTGENQGAFLKFDLSGISAGSTINSAALYAYDHNGTYDDSITIDALRVDNDDWDESTITWNNAPWADVGAVLDSDLVEAGVGKWNTWDVTSFVAGEFAGDGEASILLQSEDEGPPEDEAAGYNSKESTYPEKVYLSVIYTPEAPGTQYVCTFLYPWYGHYRHWDAGTYHNPPDTWAANYLPDPQPEIFDPASELYDSNDDAIILWQLNSMKRAGIRVAISSWWGIGTYEDQAFRKIITDVMDRPDNPYRDLKWCIYYEEEGYGNPSVGEICDDLNYVANNYGSLPFYFKLDEKIVIFVYAGNENAEYAQRWKEVRDNLGNVYIVLKVFGGYYPDYASFADSWHQYGPAIRYESQIDYSAFVSPGFWGCHKSPRLTRDLNEFENAVENLLTTSGCKFLLIQTWNEWHEGTQIEPGQLIDHDDWNPPFTPADNSYGYEFIDALARHAYSLMPQPVIIEYVSPLDGAVIRNSRVNVEIKVKDNYSENLDAYISLDGNPSQQMEFMGSDNLGYLRFKKYIENLSDGDHYTIVYTKNEFDYFSHNARIVFNSARPNVNVEITPAHQSGLSGEDLYYTVVVTNIGTVPDNYTVTVEDTEGWGPMPSDNLLEIPAGENKNVTLSVTVPENAEHCTEDTVTVTATSQENAQVSDSAICFAHAAAWGGTATFELENMYAVGLEKDLQLYLGSKLVVKFYTYEDAFENENVIKNFSPPWHVEENEIARHPEGKAVKKVKLVLTYEDTENVISTITSFTVRRSTHMARIAEIDLRWPYAPFEERSALMAEIAAIDVQWPYAPT